MALYDQIGRTYDVTRQADPYIASRLAALLDPRLGELYLDIGCGSGNYTSALAAAGLRMVGVDLSPVMLRSARRKLPPLAWVLSDASALPFHDRAFQGAVCTLALHHFSSISAVFAEVGRVVTLGGRFVAFTSTPEQMDAYWLNEYFPEAMKRSAQRMPSLDTVRIALSQAGFVIVDTEPYEVQKDVKDLFLYAAKHRPELYLDPHVRAGMSTFAGLASPDEITAGCARLAEDIASGRFRDVANRSRLDGGDYLFITAERRA
jgi:ubiquinone/menaquinone biosynthesis C-methylase UbiE